MVRKSGGRAVAWMAVTAMLAGCGGGGGGNGGAVAVVPGATPSATATPAATTSCSVRARQDWIAEQVRSWYLFPETLPASLDPTPYPTADAFLDALTATARSQRRDRYFTYLTSIAEENAYYSAGETAGFGIRLASNPGGGLVVTEAFEGAPALAAGIDRGSVITGIGPSTASIRAVDEILSQEGSAGLDTALGRNTPGTTRAFRVVADGATREVVVTKADFALSPVSPRYGVRIIEDAGKRVGYLNLRTFISTADQQLRDAFAGFRAAGVTEVIVDLRYNGGGLVSTANLFSDLLGANRSAAEVQSRVSFRPDKSGSDETTYWRAQPQSIAPTRIAFIGTGGTASASELVINTMIPFLPNDVALIGDNTYGKPVGQIALDNPGCGDRLRIVAFALQNANRQGAYFSGLATVVPASCRAGDSYDVPLGDPREASIAKALEYLRRGGCVPITATASRQATPLAAAATLLRPEHPSAAQREVPGLF